MGGRRRNHRRGRAGEACAFKEIAAAGIGGTAALRHESSLERQYLLKERSADFLIA
jgi:hypothetical protein